MQEIELEKTFLAKYIPQDLSNYKSRELLDLYIPVSAKHPKLRIRKKGDDWEITKKSPVKEGDASHQIEHTIKLSQEEFAELSKIPAKKISKTRYYFDYDNLIAEVDVFQNDLLGLVVVDFEFESIATKDAFVVPDFCLAEVTQEEFIAGGKICGKTYTDIEKELEKFGYKKLFLKQQL